MNLVLRSGVIAELGRAGEIDVDCGSGEVFIVAGERNRVPFQKRVVGSPVLLVSANFADIRRRTPYTACDYIEDNVRSLQSVSDHAEYWTRGARKEPDRSTALLASEQAANAWKNAAYALARRLDEITKGSV